MTRHTAALALGLCVGLAALGASPQTSPQAPAADPQRPTIRAGVNFVRVDVFAYEAGRPVTDLGVDDFAVQEDGVAQTIATFEHIVIRGGTAPETRRDPRNTREAVQMAGDPRNRLFVLFLDTYLRFASADLALAPLGPGDYLIELSVRRGQRTDRVLAAFRIVP